MVSGQYLIVCGQILMFLPVNVEGEILLLSYGLSMHPENRLQWTWKPSTYWKKGKKSPLFPPAEAVRSNRSMLLHLSDLLIFS